MGIRGYGASKEEAFEQAAVALTAVITDHEKVEPLDQRNRLRDGDSQDAVQPVPCGLEWTLPRR